MRTNAVPPSWRSHSKPAPPQHGHLTVVSAITWPAPALGSKTLGRGSRTLGTSGVRAHGADTRAVDPGGRTRRNRGRGRSAGRSSTDSQFHSASRFPFGFNGNHSGAVAGFVPDGQRDRKQTPWSTARRCALAGVWHFSRVELRWLAAKHAGGFHRLPRRSSCWRTISISKLVDRCRIGITFPTRSTFGFSPSRSGSS
jgi:hypothetical protein